MGLKIVKKASAKKPPAYVVGYGKPPKSTQFKPGQSGNPKGRRKGLPSLSDMVIAEAARLVKVQTGGTVQHLSKKQALIRKLFEMGLHGNMKAVQLGLALLATGEAAGGPAAASEEPLSEAELAILKDVTSLLRRRASHEASMPRRNAQACSPGSARKGAQLLLRLLSPGGAFCRA